jgi:HK97 family phage major capsid protein
MRPINELKDKRACLIAKQRELVDKAWAETRSTLNGEEEQTYQNIEVDIKALEAEIKREEDLSGRESSLEYRREFQTVNPQKSQETPEKSELNFLRYLRGEISNAEYRDLSSTAAAGGYTIPQTMASQIVIYQRQFGTMRQIAYTFTTATGEPLTIPRVTAFGSSGWNTEGAAFTESDPTFGQVTLNSYKSTHIAQVSEELLVDSAFDIGGLLGRIFGQNLGVLQNNAFVVGDGSNKPTGICNNVTSGKTGASNVAVTADELVDLYHSVLPAYRVNGSWVMHDNTVAAIRKVKTGIANDTTYVWQPGLQAGAPDTIFGKPVYADPDMATMANSAKSILFGDFKAGYWIRDVGGMGIQRLNELYAGTGQVGFRIWQRVDAKQVDAIAIKCFTNNAS